MIKKFIGNHQKTIILIFNICFIILTFLINLLYLKTNIEITLIITFLTLSLLIISYITWKKNKINYLWPLFLGILVTCWWPYLDWLSTDNSFIKEGYIIIKIKWYNSLKFKLSISLLPIIIGYIIILYNNKYKK